jgi:nucleotide-binding universal stress UspA family protein
MRAIAIAQEQDAAVVFLHISDIHFLDHAASPVDVEVVQEQLEEMGEFLLVMAQERAREAGVESEAEVRQGEFRQSLEAVIQEKEISMVVLGSGSQGTGITTPEYRQGLADYLVENYGIEVIISAVGEIVQHVKPKA